MPSIRKAMIAGALALTTLSGAAMAADPMVGGAAMYPSKNIVLICTES